ncbi:MAG TPA: hypothetical protein VE618_00670, partial [Myxococcaceae bacterium]|nr:hypothetical protein [Myxococcaceae bacterium]
AAAAPLTVESGRPAAPPRRPTRMTGSASALAPPLPAPVPTSVTLAPEPSPASASGDELALELDDDLGDAIEGEAIEELDPEPEPVVLPSRRR